MRPLRALQDVVLLSPFRYHVAIEFRLKKVDPSIRPKTVDYATRLIRHWLILFLHWQWSSKSAGVFQIRRILPPPEGFLLYLYRSS